MSALHLAVETTELCRLLQALAASLERFPELVGGTQGALDALAEPCVLQVHGLAAPGAGHLVVRLEPGDGLRRLVAAARARDPEFGFAEGL